MIFLILIALLLAVIAGFWLVGQLVGLVLTLFIAGLIGAAAGSWLKYKGGMLFSIGAGLVGAVVGTVLANVLNMPKLLTIADLPILWTVVGSLAVVGAAKVIAPRSDSRQLGKSNQGLLR